MDDRDFDDFIHRNSDMLPRSTFKGAPMAKVRHIGGGGGGAYRTTDFRMQLHRDGNKNSNNGSDDDNDNNNNTSNNNNSHRNSNGNSNSNSNSNNRQAGSGRALGFDSEKQHGIETKNTLLSRGGMLKEWKAVRLARYTQGDDNDRREKANYNNINNNNKNKNNNSKNIHEGEGEKAKKDDANVITIIDDESDKEKEKQETRQELRVPLHHLARVSSPLKPSKASNASKMVTSTFLNTPIIDNYNNEDNNNSQSREKSRRIISGLGSRYDGYEFLDGDTIQPIRATKRNRFKVDSFSQQHEEQHAVTAPAETAAAITIKVHQSAQVRSRHAPQPTRTKVLRLKELPQQPFHPEKAGSALWVKASLTRNALHTSSGPSSARTAPESQRRKSISLPSSKTSLHPKDALERINTLPRPGTLRDIWERPHLTDTRPLAGAATKSSSQFKEDFSENTPPQSPRLLQKREERITKPKHVIPTIAKSSSLQKGSPKVSPLFGRRKSGQRDLGTDVRCDLASARSSGSPRQDASHVNIQPPITSPTQPAVAHRAVPISPLLTPKKSFASKEFSRNTSGSNSISLHLPDRNRSTTPLIPTMKNLKRKSMTSQPESPKAYRHLSPAKSPRYITREIARLQVKKVELQNTADSTESLNCRVAKLEGPSQAEIVYASQTRHSAKDSNQTSGHNYRLHLTDSPSPEEAHLERKSSPVQDQKHILGSIKQKISTSLPIYSPRASYSAGTITFTKNKKQCTNDDNDNLKAAQISKLNEETVLCQGSVRMDTTRSNPTPDLDIGATLQVMKKREPAFKLESFEGLNRVEAAQDQALSCLKLMETNGGAFNVSCFLLTDEELASVFKKALDELSKNNTDEMPIWNLLLCHNRLERFDVKLMTSVFSELRVLDLTDNHLEMIPDFIFDLSNLECLSICQNHVKSIPLKIRQLEKLRILNLSQNEISEIPTGIFSSLKKLKILLLDGNQLKGLPNDLGDLVDLECLNLENNKLRSVPGSAYNIKNIESANFDGNPLMQLLTQAPPNAKLSARQKLVFFSKYSS